MKTKDLMQGKTIAILTGGGDTPALNSSIKHIRDNAVALGHKVFGVKQGWKGLLEDGDIVDITDVKINASAGGTFLRSSRTNAFNDDPAKDKSHELMANLKRYKIDVLIAIGGDDTIGAAKKLYQQEKFPVIAFPKTIDNDLRTKTYHTFNGTKTEAVLCPGFPTAAQSIVDFTNRIKTYSQSHARVLIMEVMGRDAGWLTGVATYAGANFALIPEMDITKERKSAFINKIKEAYEKSKSGYLIIAVAEGVKWYNEKEDKPVFVHASSELDAFGHPAFGGVSGVIAADINNAIDLPAKGVVTGFYARSGSCGKYDLKLTKTLADKVKVMLVENDFGKMPVMNTISSYDDIKLENCSTIALPDVGNKPLDMQYYNKEEFTFNKKYIDFLSKIIQHNDDNMFDANLQRIDYLMID